jgi:hypothetical protein
MVGWLGSIGYICTIYIYAPYIYGRGPIILVTARTKEQNFLILFILYIYNFIFDSKIILF